MHVLLALPLAPSANHTNNCYHPGYVIINGTDLGTYVQRSAEPLLSPIYVRSMGWGGGGGASTPHSVEGGERVSASAHMVPSIPPY